MTYMYIDDILLFGDTVEECRKNVDITKRYLEKLGFVIHEKKSQFEPNKSITFWGNKINSERMIVELTEERKEMIYEECLSLMNRNHAKRRIGARVIGLIISSFPATELGQLHYRLLESEKNKISKRSKRKL